MSSNSDITSGEHITLWLDKVDIPSYKPLGSTIVEADVCVVGGGLAGLSTAYALAVEGKKVVLLESREIMSGESGRTTAMLMSALDDRFYAIKEMHGAVGAKMAAQSHIQAVNIIEENAKRENIDCDFVRLDAYLFSEPSQASELDTELPYAIEAGHVGAHIIENAPIPGMSSAKAIVFPNQGQFHPVKYMAGLAKGITSRGGQIFTHTRASEFNDGPNASVKTTENGVVNCKNIVVATCNPVVNSFSMILKQEPYRSYVIVGDVPKGSVKSAMFWDNQDPYHYARLSPKDATSDWLIIGGEDHRVGAHPSDIGSLYKNLESWTRGKWPQFGAVSYKWSGEVWEPLDFMGFIGLNPGAKNIYIISGDSGTGMTHTTLGGKIITDLILGRENEWAKLYDPTRKPTSLKAVAKFARSQMEGSVGYLKWLKLGDVSDIEDIKPCSGGVILKNHQYIAAYKDEHNVMHACSAVCTHLGGIVTWNDDEKSWDCRCHGSRFDKFGKVIAGPANKDLSKASLN